MLSFSSFSLASALLSKDLQASLALFASVTDLGMSIGAIWTVLSSPVSSVRVSSR